MFEPNRMPGDRPNRVRSLASRGWKMRLAIAGLLPNDFGASSRGRSWLMTGLFGGLGIAFGLAIAAAGRGPAIAASADEPSDSVVADVESVDSLERQAGESVDLGYLFEGEIAALTLAVDTTSLGKLVAVKSTCPCVSVREQIDGDGQRYLRSQAADTDMPSRPMKLSARVDAEYQTPSGVDSKRYTVRLSLVPSVRSEDGYTKAVLTDGLNQPLVRPVL